MVVLMGGIDADASDWASRVNRNGGTVASSTVRAVSRLVRQTKAAGIWPKLNRFSVFQGDQLAAALVPLKTGGGSATDANVNFVAADYSSATGLTGDGSSKYLDTGLAPSVAMTTSSGSLWFYAGTAAVPGAGNVMIGASGAAGVDPTYLVDDAGTTLRGAIASAYADAAVATATSLGFVGVSVNGSRVQSFYRNGAQVGTQPTAAGNLAADSVYVFALNAAAVASSFSPENCRAYAIGQGLSASEALTFNTIMEAFQDEVGRGVQ